MGEPTGDWLTYPTESVDSGRNIIVSERQDLEKFRKNRRFIYRITMGMPYAGDAKGMPDEATSDIIEQVTERMNEVLKADPIAVLVEVSTGDDRREWVFQTLSLGIFNKKLNEALAPLPDLPLDFSAEEDADFLLPEG